MELYGEVVDWPEKLSLDDNHMVFKKHDANIYFSATQNGLSMNCHFCSDRAGLRGLKRAINEFCDFIFNKYGWCRMIIANIDRGSVERLVSKCGFSMFATIDENNTFWMRCRDGIC